MKTKFDPNALSQKLNSIRDELDEEKNSFKELVHNISEIDETNVSLDTLYSVLNEEEKQYHIMNEEYKELVSRFSYAYVEMSEWYCGPELPIDVFRKIYKDKDKKTYKKTDYEETYLDSKEGIQELYKLFIFVFLFELHIQKIEVE